MTTKIQYTTKINSNLTTDVNTIDAGNYKEICEALHCYEKLPDDRPIKLYFDIDFYDENMEYCEAMSDNIITIAKKTHQRVCC